MRLLHIGLLLVAIAMFVGKTAPRLGWISASHDLQMAEGDKRDVDERLSLTLKRFEIHKYPSGKPKQFVSTVSVFDRDAKSFLQATISVNHPLRIKGWWVYQYGWGPDENGEICTSLRCVKDVGLPFAAFGGMLLLAGSLGFCFGKQDVMVRKSFGWRKWIGVVCACLVVALPIFIIGRTVMRPEPVPALQSWLMVPHVASYAMSYLLLLFAAFGIGRRWVSLGFFLMTVGLVAGATWGKLAWSDWWQFDPKENWSFVTWLAFCAYMHMDPNSRTARCLLWIGAALILITLTWVNFSRMTSGLHSYAL